MPDLEPKDGEVTKLLLDLRSGSKQAEERLIVLVYDQLRQLAASYLRAERADHTLQPTALVHEAYLRLVKVKDTDWKNRAHFFAVAATIMRHILVDHARNRCAKKREGVNATLSLDEGLVVSNQSAAEIVALDDALGRLAEIDPRQSKIVELRFFGGLNEEETGSLLGISSRTVKRDWRVARAWLYSELRG